METHKWNFWPTNTFTTTLRGRFCHCPLLEETEVWRAETTSPRLYCREVEEAGFESRTLGPKVWGLTNYVTLPLYLVGWAGLCTWVAWLQTSRVPPCLINLSSAPGQCPSWAFVSLDPNASPSELNFLLLLKVSQFPNSLRACKGKF